MRGRGGEESKSSAETPARPSFQFFLSSLPYRHGYYPPPLPGERKPAPFLRAQSRGCVRVRACVRACVPMRAQAWPEKQTQASGPGSGDEAGARSCGWEDGLGLKWT